MAIVNKALWAIGALAALTASVGYLARAQDADMFKGGPQGQALTVEKRAYDMQKLAHPAAIPDDVFRGRAIWLQRCAYCHDGVGQPSYQTLGPWIDSSMVADLSDDGVRQFITTGTDKMPSFQYALSDKQIDDVIAYLKTISPADKPTEAQLAGKAAKAPGGD